MMFATKLAPTYNTLLDFLVEKATPEEILGFTVTPEEQARAEELTEKNKAGRLTDSEAEELTALLETDLFIMGLKARALVALKQK